jgi:phosphocarrier protein HPr
MPSLVVTVGSIVGLHARPAALLVKAAQASGLAVTISRSGGPSVNAASMLSVLGMGVKHGEELEISVGEGENAEATLAQISELIATDHDAV